MDNMLSVIVPVYNVEKYIKQCIQSLINQTYVDLEILLVDDGATDLSGIICDDYSKHDKRIRVIHKENGGLISARYVGLLEAKYEYVTFVDGDDWIKPNMYEEMMELMLQNNVDMVASGNIIYWDEEDYGEHIDKMIEEGLFDIKKIENKVIPQMLWCKECNNWAVDPSLCDKIFKKDILLNIYEKLKNETFYFGEDTAIIYPYILESKKIYFTHKCYYYHRQRPRGTFAYYLAKEDFFGELNDVYKYLKKIFKSYEQKEILLKQLDYFFIRSATMRKWKYNDTEGSSFSYLFPFDKVEKSSRVVLYGAGRVGKEYYEQVERLQYCNIVLWVDKNYNNFQNKRVNDIKEIFNIEYDYIVIANLSEDIKLLIAKQLMEMGVHKDNIVT